MQFTKLAMALFAATALAAPAASPVDVDDSLATTTVMLDMPTGATGVLLQVHSEEHEVRLWQNVLQVMGRRCLGG